MRQLLFASLMVLMQAPASALVILQYHHISDSTPAVTSTSPALFERHLEIIAESGFEVLDLDRVAGQLRSGKALPDKAVLITFDDSYSSIYETAFPLLKARGWPFVVFANTEPVDRGLNGFMSWPQLLEMAENGAAVANHTVSHLHLVRPPAGTTEAAWGARVQREIEYAESRIATNIKQGHKVLAFPYGEFDNELLELLEVLGYLGMSQSSGAVARGERMALPRFPMGGRYGREADFRLKLHALPVEVDQLQLRNQDGDKLDDSVLPAGVSRPILELRLEDQALNGLLNCYASGQVEAIGKSLDGAWLRFQTQTPLPAGRSRYNCTARDAASGRYHWFSVPFLRPRDDGSWPPEP